MQDNAIGPDMKKKAQYFQKCYQEVEKIWGELDKLEFKDLK